MNKKYYGICGYGHLTEKNAEFGQHDQCTQCSAPIVFRSDDSITYIRFGDGCATPIGLTYNLSSSLEKEFFIKHLIGFFRTLCVHKDMPVHNYIASQIKIGKYSPLFADNQFWGLMFNACKEICQENSEETPSMISDVKLIEGGSRFFDKTVINQIKQD